MEPLSFIYRALMTAGGWWCHQLPERSPHLLGAQLPLCWRCSGIALGAALFLCWLVAKKRLPPMGLSLLLASALPLDVLLTVLTGGGLDNPRRFLTGLLWGLFGTSAALRLAALLRRRRDPSARADGGRPLPA